jgi:hypothetical protein
VKKLYIDVDGVLLGKHNPDNMEVVLAKHAKEFLEFCLKKYDCYWLTTHCKDGDNTYVLRWLKKYADNEVLDLAKAIKATKWETLKTDAIDFSSDFYWIDDEPLSIEIDILKKNNSYNKWLYINTWDEPDGLYRGMIMLEELDKK